MPNAIIVFPGQGSQTIGMGKDFYENFKESKLVFEESEDATKVNLAKLCFEGPAQDLQLTENLQPALFTVEMAIFKAFLVHVHGDLSFVKVMAGHSLGEYTALSAVNSLNIFDGAKLCKNRGYFMQKAVPQGEGAMLAVLGLDDLKVEKLCSIVQESTKQVVEPANYNSPGQVVISGTKQSIQEAESRIKNDLEFKGAKAIPLDVSAPFHCSLMKPAQNEMAPLLKSTKFKKPTHPIINNVEAKISFNENNFADDLIKQITSPVRWTQSMQKCEELEITHLIEIGPGKVLSGLIKRINRNIQAHNISNFEQLKSFKLA